MALWKRGKRYWTYFSVNGVQLRRPLCAPNSRLDEMESFFAHACQRVSELEAVPRRIPGKSYLTR